MGAVGLCPWILTPGSSGNQEASSAGIFGLPTISGWLACPLLGFAGATGCTGDAAHLNLKSGRSRPTNCYFESSSGCGTASERSRKKVTTSSNTSFPTFTARWMRSVGSTQSTSPTLTFQV